MVSDTRHVLVTGAGGAFGSAICADFASEGGVVIACDRDRTALANLTSKSNQIVEETAELDSLSEINALVARILERHRHIDVLVNCAGICSGTGVFDLTESEWDRTFAINVKAPFFLSQKIARCMVEDAERELRDDNSPRHRSIINVSSLVAFTGGILSNAAYSSSKAALTCTTKNLAKALAPYHITVNEVAPGTADTPMSRSFIGPELSGFEKQIPLGRLCGPEDVASAVAFLASPRATHVTGHTIHVNGGQFMA